MTRESAIVANAAGGCIAIGNFDGVHGGHRRMLGALMDMAAALQTRSVAVTFHPHPISVLQPKQAPPLLTTIPDRRELLLSAGIDEVVVLPVTSDLLQMSADDFFRDFVVHRMRAQGIVEGENFRFGRDRSGDVGTLRSLCHDAAIPLRVVELVQDGGCEISSSRIRRAISEGRMRQAVEMLGHPYRLRGTVHQGAMRGASLGFPTANLGGVTTLLPAHGVYAALTAVAGRHHVTAVSLGPNPTFGEHSVKVECHLDGYSGTLYGHEIAVDLIAEVRGLRQFETVESLVGQIRSDVERCRELAGSHFSH